MRALENGYGVIPRGTIAIITKKHGGLSLQSEPCACCGMRVGISKVPYQHVALLPISLQQASIIPNEGLCLIKVPAGDMDTMTGEEVERIEKVIGKPTLIIPQDFDVYLDRAAGEELFWLRDAINEALERGKRDTAATEAATGEEKES